MTLTEDILVYAAQTDTGRVRGHNEDALLCCAELNLWAVADGMGGHQRGEVASTVALAGLRAAVERGETLRSAVLAANAAVVSAGEEEAGARGMGTTLVAVRFTGTATFELAWAGDSRAYRVGAEGIERLSHDHSWVQTMIDAGEMSEDEARLHPRRNIVLQCLGQDQVLEPGIIHGTLEADELLLLCSDGLTNELSDPQIQQACLGAATLDELVAQLIEQANQMGGSDNISCIALGRLVADPPASVEARPRGFLSRLLSGR